MSLSISNIGAIGGVQQVQSLRSSASVGRAGDGDNDGPRGGGLTSAINQTLSQQGASGTSGISSQSLADFLQKLLAALQAQASTQGGSQSSDQDGMQKVQNQAGVGPLQSGLSSLATQLSSGSTNSADAALQQSFQNLMGSSNSSSNDLASFLQALSQNIQGMGSSGNVISATA